MGGWLPSRGASGILHRAPRLQGAAAVSSTLIDLLPSLPLPSPPLCCCFHVACQHLSSIRTSVIRLKACPKSRCSSMDFLLTPVFLQRCDLQIRRHCQVPRTETWLCLWEALVLTDEIKEANVI